MAPVSRMAAGHITCLSGDESRTISSIVERISVLYVVGDNNNGSVTVELLVVIQSVVVNVCMYDFVITCKGYQHWWK